MYTTVVEYPLDVPLLTIAEDILYNSTFQELSHGNEPDGVNVDDRGE